jgi:hypothetical protein
MTSCTPEQVSYALVVSACISCVLFTVVFLVQYRVVPSAVQCTCADFESIHSLTPTVTLTPILTSRSHT